MTSDSQKDIPESGNPYGLTLLSVFFLNSDSNNNHFFLAKPTIKPEPERLFSAIGLI